MDSSLALRKAPPLRVGHFTKQGSLVEYGEQRWLNNGLNISKAGWAFVTPRTPFEGQEKLVTKAHCQVTV